MSTPVQCKRARILYARRREAGLCVRCGKERGEDGTKTRCRECLDHEKLRRATV